MFILDDNWFTGQDEFFRTSCQTVLAPASLNHAPRDHSALPQHQLPINQDFIQHIHSEDSFNFKCK